MMNYSRIKQVKNPKLDQIKYKNEKYKTIKTIIMATAIKANLHILQEIARC